MFVLELVIVAVGLWQDATRYTPRNREAFMFVLELVIVAVGLWQAYRLGYVKGLSEGLSVQIEKIYTSELKKDKPSE